MIKALEELTSTSENVQTRGEAELVLNSLLRFDIFLSSVLLGRGSKRN